MAHLGQKDNIFHVRFRINGREYKKSLKTSDRSAAGVALHTIELTLHRLLIGEKAVPDGVDPGDFILSGGTIQKPPDPPPPPLPPPPAKPSTRTLIEKYKESQKNVLAPTYHSSQATHLRHLVRHLGDLADAPCDQVTFEELDGYLKKRLEDWHKNTVERERITLLQFYKWLVEHKHLTDSPAVRLKRIAGGKERGKFRTLEEITRILGRGGLTKEEELAYWECLYLNPEEIASLLATVRTKAKVDYSFLLHAIPAYTGMRRGEVLRLRWIEVDLDSNEVTARSRKQSRTNEETVRSIDLHAELKAELIAWREQRPRGQYVICDARTLEPINPDRANRCFWQPMRHTEWCLNNAKDWFKVGFHTYRHSFASNLAAAGVDQRIIDQWMGHQTEAMRKRYRHLFPKNRRSAIESFSLAKAAGVDDTPPHA